MMKFIPIIFICSVFTITSCDRKGREVVPEGVIEVYDSAEGGCRNWYKCYSGSGCWICLSGQDSLRAEGLPSGSHRICAGWNTGAKGSSKPEVMLLGNREERGLELTKRGETEIIKLETVAKQELPLRELPGWIWARAYPSQVGKTQ